MLDKVDLSVKLSKQEYKKRLDEAGPIFAPQFAAAAAGSLERRPGPRRRIARPVSRSAPRSLGQSARRPLGLALRALRPASVPGQLPALTPAAGLARTAV